MTIYKYAVLIMSALIFNTKANTVSSDLAAYTAPSDMKNIHVEAIGTSKTASEFVIFIRNEVKPHIHEYHTELVYVLEGEAIFWLGETKQIIKPGDFVRIDEGVIHGAKVTSKTPLKILSIQTPEFVGKDRVFIKQ